MKTLKRFYFVSALIGAAIVGWGSANAELNLPTDTKTELSSSSPTYKQITDATKKPTSSIDFPALDISLVGHWGRYIDGEISKTDQRYFGELNADGIGKYFEFYEGNYIEGTYQVRSEDLDSTEVVFLIKGDPNALIRSLKLTRFFSHPYAEGLAEYQYIDSQTEPKNRPPIVKKYKYE